MVVASPPTRLNTPTSHSRPLPTLRIQSLSVPANCPFSYLLKPCCRPTFSCIPLSEVSLPYRRKCCLPFVTASFSGLCRLLSWQARTAFLPTSPLNNRGPGVGGSRLCDGSRGLFSMINTGMTVCYSKHYLSLSEVYFCLSFSSLLIFIRTI